MKPELQSTEDLQKCQDTLLQKHSDHYYAALFTVSSQRAVLTACFAMLEEIRTIPYSCSDRGVARTKLAWWGEEIIRLQQHEARHPATRGLQAHVLQTRGLQNRGIPDELLTRYLEGVSRDLEYDAYPTQAELSDLARRIGGTQASICAHFLGVDDRVSKDVEKAGSALFLGQRGLELAEHARRGRVYLPLDLLENNGIAPEALQDDKADQALRKILEKYTEDMQQRLNTSLAELPAGMNYLAILARFHELRFKQVKKHRFDLLAFPPAISPLRQLWTAWRAARVI